MAEEIVKMQISHRNNSPTEFVIVALVPLLPIAYATQITAECRNDDDIFLVKNTHSMCPLETDDITRHVAATLSSWHQLGIADHRLRRTCSWRGGGGSGLVLDDVAVLLHGLVGDIDRVADGLVGGEGSRRVGGRHGGAVDRRARAVAETGVARGGVAEAGVAEAGVAQRQQGGKGARQHASEDHLRTNKEGEI